MAEVLAAVLVDEEEEEAGVEAVPSTKYFSRMGR